MEFTYDPDLIGPREFADIPCISADVRYFKPSEPNKYQDGYYVVGFVVEEHYNREREKTRVHYAALEQVLFLPETP